MQATINLLPKQTEAWDCFESEQITELGYGGAAGGGKTRLGWFIAVFGYAEKYQGSRFAVGRKELKTLRITTLAELFSIFNEIGYKKDIDYVFDAKDSIIRFPNKSEIILLDTAFSPQDPEYTRFGSLNLTGAWVEESNETPEKAKSILKTRVGRHNKFIVDGKEVIAKAFWLETFNPNKGHVFRDYYKPWKEGTLPNYRAFIRALPGDNPYLPKVYIENLKRADKTTRERLLLGNFEYDADPLKIMSYDAINDLVTNTILESDEKFLINDIARFGGDKIVLGYFVGLMLKGLYVYTYQGLDETVKKIKYVSVKHQIPYSHILSDEDGVGGGVLDNLKGTKGFIGNSSPFTLWDTKEYRDIPQNFTNLRSQCYFKLGDLVNQHEMAINIDFFETNIEGLTLEKVISEMVEELDQIKKKETQSQSDKLAIIPKNEIKEILGRSPDFADMLMMRTYFEFDAPSSFDETRRISTYHQRQRVMKNVMRKNI